MVSFKYSGREGNEFDIQLSSIPIRSPHILPDILALAEEKGLTPFHRRIPIPGGEYDWEIGWWYGALISDGWITNKMIGYAKLDSDKRAAFVDIVRRKFSSDITVREYSEDGSGDNKLGESTKVHISGGSELAQSVFCCNREPCNEEEAAKRGALRKIIPREILQGGSRDCLLGLLAGLLEGDGTLTWNRNTKNPRPVIRFSTSSPYLVEDIKVLGRYFGVRVTVTTIKPRNRSNTAYGVCFSIPDMQKLGTEMRFMTDKANDFWSKFIGRPEAKDHLDVVPVSYAEASLLMTLHPTNSRLYGNAAEARSAGRTTRKTGKLLLEGVRPGICPLLKAVVAADDVCWRVKKPDFSDN